MATKKVKEQEMEIKAVIMVKGDLCSTDCSYLNEDYAGDNGEGDFVASCDQFGDAVFSSDKGENYERCEQCLKDAKPIVKDDKVGRVEIDCNEDMTDGAVYIYNKDGNEIMSWNADEWQEDVTSVVATCNAIRIFYTEGEAALQKICGRKFKK